MQQDVEIVILEKCNVIRSSKGSKLTNTKTERYLLASMMLSEKGIDMYRLVERNIENASSVNRPMWLQISSCFLFRCLNTNGNENERKTN